MEFYSQQKCNYEITYFREIDSIQVKFKFIRIWGSGRQQKWIGMRSELNHQAAIQQTRRYDYLTKE